MSNTEFEGGDDGHGHGDCTFLVKQAQPSHILACFHTIKMGAAKEVQAPKMRQSQGLVQLLVLESAEEVAGRKARYAGGRHSR